MKVRVSVFGIALVQAPVPGAPVQRGRGPAVGGFDKAREGASLLARISLLPGVKETR
jgi:hypothetical protein